MARSREAFTNVINNYNSHDQIRGALQVNYHFTLYVNIYIYIYIYISS